MQQPDPGRAEPDSLARLLDLNDEALWEPGELGDVLRHQLDAPVDFDLSRLGPAPGETLRSIHQSGMAPIHSFRDLFDHEKPPVSLLKWTKQFARSCRSREEGGLPDEVATVLYFLAIVTAMTKCEKRISGLDDESLKYGLRWALRQRWLDGPTRRILQRGLEIVPATGQLPAKKERE